MAAVTPLVSLWLKNLNMPLAEEGLLAVPCTLYLRGEAQLQGDYKTPPRKQEESFKVICLEK